MSRTADTDVSIVGAGPYGLSLAAQLQHRGVAFRIFGEPMRFWQMLGSGRYLKSYGFATNIYGPGCHTFETYCHERSLEASEPCAIEDFARYGIWVQQQRVPNLEPVDIVHVATQKGGPEPGFVLTTARGETFRSRRLIVAVGLRYFGFLPPELSALPRQLVTHTSVLDDFSVWKDKDVCILGAGQSALESAALLREAGARPTLFARAEAIHFGGRTPIEGRPLRQRLRAPQSVLGPGLKNWALENFPTLLHRAPNAVRVPFTRSHLGPSGAWWVRDRVEGKLPIHVGASLAGARQVGARLALTFRVAGGERAFEFDHVVAGTGYTIDVDRLGFLDAELRDRLRRVDRAPALDLDFQTSVPGLYVVGPASAPSFGPLFRFVAGAAYCAPALALHLTGRTASTRSARLSRALRLGQRLVSAAAQHAPERPRTSAQLVGDVDHSREPVPPV
jgi:thioredoxin reductase